MSLFAKLLDFGVAKLLDQAGPPITRANEMVGTTSYMSPEQIRGEAVDARADVFAMGCVLYEMLTGHRAFHRETPAQTMLAILNNEPPNFAVLPPPIVPILQRALAPVAAMRFGSADEMQNALTPYATRLTQSSIPVPGTAAGPASMPHVGPSLPPPAYVGPTLTEAQRPPQPAVKPRRWWPPILALLVVVLGAVGAAVVWAIRASSVPPIASSVPTASLQPAAREQPLASVPPPQISGTNRTKSHAPVAPGNNASGLLLDAGGKSDSGPQAKQAADAGGVPAKQGAYGGPCNADGTCNGGGLRCLVDGRCGCSGNNPDTCNGACVNLKWSAGDCGACGVKCELSETCDNGRCVECSALARVRGDPFAKYARCTTEPHQCVNLSVDVFNCGACGNRCNPVNNHVNCNMGKCAP
jgi:hypothetical protein